MDYETIALRIFDKEDSIIGEVAVQQAAQLDMFALEDGDLTVTRSLDKQDIVALIDRYQQIVGEAAIGTARNALNDLDTEDIDLPEKLMG